MQRDEIIFGGLIGGAALLIVGAITLGVMAIYWEGQRCQEAGGRVVSKTSLGVGFTGGGQMAVTPTTVSFCVTPDGRILF